MAKECQQVARGPDPVEKQASRGVKPVAKEIATLESYETRNPCPLSSTQGKHLTSHRVQHRKSSMPTDMKDKAVEKRCVPTSQWTGVRPMVVRIWRMVNLVDCHKDAVDGH